MILGWHTVSAASFTTKLPTPRLESVTTPPPPLAHSSTGCRCAPLAEGTRYLLLPSLSLLFLLSSSQLWASLITQLVNSFGPSMVSLGKGRKERKCSLMRGFIFHLLRRVRLGLSPRQFFCSSPSAISLLASTAVVFKVGRCLSLGWQLLPPGSGLPGVHCTC